MKHVLSAAAALAFGLGVAISAQAQAPQGNMAQGNMGQGNMGQGHNVPQTANQPPRMTGMTGPAQMQRSRVHYPKSHTAMVKEAQSRLKRGGFYNGKIDGRMGHETRQALAKFERQHGLPVTNRLNRRTFAVLILTPVAGVGSSMPHQPGPGQANGMAHPMTGPAPTQAPGAGGPYGGSNGGGANAGGANGANAGR